MDAEKKRLMDAWVENHPGPDLGPDAPTLDDDEETHERWARDWWRRRGHGFRDLSHARTIVVTQSYTPDAHLP
jgi:hypothetical protein